MLCRFFIFVLLSSLSRVITGGYPPAPLADAYLILERGWLAWLATCCGYLNFSLHFLAALFLFLLSCRAQRSIIDNGEEYWAIAWFEEVLMEDHRPEACARLYICQSRVDVLSIPLFVSLQKDMWTASQKIT